MRLFSYKLTHDGGFAPNPFWGILTLATCKPQIRLHKHPGDWIAGFTSTALCADAVGQERLIYLMQIDRKLQIARYFRDPAFAKKIPVRHSARQVERVGDNIYRPRNASASAPSDFTQVPNDSHYDGTKGCTIGESQRRDLSGVYVLIATRFAYFGGVPLLIPSPFRNQPTRFQLESLFRHYLRAATPPQASLLRHAAETLITEDCFRYTCLRVAPALVIRFPAMRRTQHSPAR